jgi:prolipoprotein diacylglyceryltransferase
MYATISDLLNDLLGLNIPLPIQTFGFFMGLSFMAAYYVSVLELKRKESLGLIKAFNQTVTLNKRVSVQDYVSQVLVGALIGFKGLEILLHYGDLLNDTQGFILSLRGNVIGALIGGGIAYYFAKKEDYKAKAKTETTKTILVHPHEVMGNVLLIAAVSGLLGAKIFHNLENLDEFAADPIGTLFSFSGLTFYGGLIVATIMVLRYTNKKGIHWKHMIDATAPALILSYGMGRIGCHLSGDGDWGIVNLAAKPEWMAALPDWLWSYTYPHNVIGEGVPIEGCVGRHCNVLPEPVFPTPLYEVLMSFFIFGFLWLIRTRIHTAGLMFSIYLMFNGVERFLIEQIRVNTTYKIAGHAITQAEIISVALFTVGLASTLWLLSKRNQTNAA